MHSGLYILFGYDPYHELTVHASYAYFIIPGHILQFSFSFLIWLSLFNAIKKYWSFPQRHAYRGPCNEAVQKEHRLEIRYL